MKIILELQIHIHDKNVSLFPTAVAEFKISHYYAQRNFVIAFMIKPDSSKDCRIQLNKTFF